MLYFEPDLILHLSQGSCRESPPTGQVEYGLLAALVSNLHTVEGGLALIQVLRRRRVFKNLVQSSSEVEGLKHPLKIINQEACIPRNIA